MKIRLCYVAIELSRTQRRLLSMFGALALILGAHGALAVPTVWSTGDPLTAENLNANFASVQMQLDALQGKQTPPSAFHAHLTTAHSIPNGFNTQIVFDVVDFDLAGEYTPATGMFQPKNDGVYVLECGAFYAAKDGASYNTAIFRNGSPAAVMDTHAGSNGNLNTHTSKLLSLTANDTIVCTTFQTSGTTAPLIVSGPSEGRVYFSAARLH